MEARIKVVEMALVGLLAVLVAAVATESLRSLVESM
jgi:hypothetical protein